MFARWVMPRFQGSLDMPRGSYEWAVANRSTIFGPNVAALRQAFTDSGRAVPEAFDARASGARDMLAKAAEPGKAAAD